MEIYCFPVGMLRANCYLLVKKNACIVIDPGDDAEFLLEEIQRRKLSLSAILATHGHFDHIMAAGEMQLSATAPFYIRKDDLFLVKRLAATSKHFLGYDPVVIPPQKIIHLQPGILSVGLFRMEVIASPGHTPGSACFYFESENTLFTGDTLFKDAVGSIDHQYSSAKDLKHSVQDLFSLAASTYVYPGHGESISLSDNLYIGQTF